MMLYTTLCAQNKVNYGLLRKPGEEVIFGFKLKNSNKTVLICNHKSDKYIVYRFGTKDKVELQYPSILNETSWKLFSYSGYSRGGVNNSPEEIHSLAFSNNHITYKIYDNCDGFENNSDVGIFVNVNGKKATLIANSASRNGTLGLLDDKGTLIHNYYWDDNK